VIQNHLLQVVTLLTCEPPAGDERAKLLTSVRPLRGRSIGLSFQCLTGSLILAANRAPLLVLADVEKVLAQDDAVLDDYLPLDRGGPTGTAPTPPPYRSA
jgi:hypothetical protein